MGGDKFDPSQLDEAVVSYFSRETQYPSVPVSPSRRSDFTFQPIQSMNVVNSIPFQNSKSDLFQNPKSDLFQNPKSDLFQNIKSDVVVHLDMESNPLNNEDSPPSYHYNQQSVAVGTSEPPSGANSPFLSPSETPTPTMNRSRNDSGQSYMRQTPFTIADSGVSSIGSSPFISPQTTPIPHRVRTGSGHIQRACQNMRSRHSSGPGIHFVRNMFHGLSWSFSVPAKRLVFLVPL